MQTCYLAVDIGASSGRHIIGTVEHGVMALHEVYRFENRLIEKNGHLCWDMEGLVQNVIEGLKAAHDAGYTPTTVGIDTWAVDFLLLDADGTPIGDPVAYRDGRTAAMREELPQALRHPQLPRPGGVRRLGRVSGGPCEVDRGVECGETLPGRLQGRKEPDEKTV